jgi:23S rRNA (uracil1939-C5)-methyltransferase
VADAKHNAAENGIHATFLDGKAEDILPTLNLKAASDTTIVVDPPRPGFHPIVLKALIESGASEIFYVSCNPESLARDLRGLVSKYTILDVQPMDSFPHTNHVETAVRLKLS